MMAVIIFKLRFVPEDEAQDVRELLSENKIDYYETSAGIFGISMPALWLKDESQLEKARELIEEYQQVRQSRAQKEYQQQKQTGSARTLLDIFKEDPMRFIGYLLAIALVIYFTVFLFMALSH
ncbi:MAG: DUF6164 family protein [Thioalkalispiraceae bacterium]|jgi:hypothetical protein